nr:unnamed protein product [Callosobruchus analis]
MKAPSTKKQYRRARRPQFKCSGASSGAKEVKLEGESQREDKRPGNDSNTPPPASKLPRACDVTCDDSHWIVKASVSQARVIDINRDRAAMFCD